MITVNPLRPAGQLVSVPAGGGVLVAGGGSVGVLGGPVGVPAGTLGSATVVVTGDVVGECGGPPRVATMVSLPAPASPRTIAATVPAAAMRKARRTGHTQSPGYRPKRLGQPAASVPWAPAAGRSR
jgi:hypothetical protein